MAWRDRIKQYAVKTAIYVAGLLGSTPVSAHANQPEMLANEQIETIEKNDLYMDNDEKNKTVNSKTTNNSPKQSAFIHTQLQLENSPIYNSLDKEKITPINTSVQQQSDTTQLDSLNCLKWKDSKEGKEFVAAYKNVMKINDVGYALNNEDYLYLQKLSRMDLRIGMLEAAIKEYKFSPVDFITMKADEMAKSIVQKSILSPYVLGTELKGKCYYSVKRFLCDENKFCYLDGLYAYESVAWLLKNPNVVCIKTENSNVDKLPEGVIVTHMPGENGQAPAGHIYITAKGKEESTYVDSKTGESYKFTKPVQISDGYDPTNGIAVFADGFRNHRTGERYADYAYVSITRNTEVSPQTGLNILWNYAKTRSAAIVLTPRHLYAQLTELNKKSIDICYNKACYASKHFSNFNKMQTIHHDSDYVYFNRLGLPIKYKRGYTPTHKKPVYNLKQLKQKKSRQQTRSRMYSGRSR